MPSPVFWNGVWSPFGLGCVPWRQYAWPNPWTLYNPPWLYGGLHGCRMAVPLWDNGPGSGLDILDPSIGPCAIGGGIVGGAERMYYGPNDGMPIMGGWATAIPATVGMTMTCMPRSAWRAGFPLVVPLLWSPGNRGILVIWDSAYGSEPGPPPKKRCG